MQNYRICLINPPGYKHSSCFLELAILLKSSLLSMGKQCDITINELSISKTNIILGGHLIQNVSSLRGFQYIPYQLEQLGAAEGIYTENFHQFLCGALAIWDYSLQNISFLHQKGLHACCVPIGYHESLEQIPQGEHKEYDVLFYGSLGMRRNAILEGLTEQGVKVKSLFGVYGPQRDNVIAKSKIIINIHYYDTKIFEAVRLSYLINNRCFVVSEESSLNPYEKIDLCLVPYDKLIQTCLKCLANDSERDILRLQCYQQFKDHYYMSEILDSVL